MTIDQIIDLIRQKYPFELCDAASRETELAAFEQELGSSLPSDMRAFYNQFSTALVCDHYRLLALPLMLELSRSSVVSGHIPEHWLIFTDCGDNGDSFQAIQLNGHEQDWNPVIDLDLDDNLMNAVVAKTFTDLISDIIFNEGEDWYWVKKRTYVIGHMRYFPGSDWHRVHDRKYWDSLDMETGTLKCARPGCGRDNLFISAFCRQHHYEQSGVPCPFVENAISFPGKVVYTTRDAGPRKP